MQCDETFDTNSILWKQRFHEVILFCSTLYWQNDRDEFLNSIAYHLRNITCANNVNIRILSSAQDSFVTYATYGDIDPALLEEYNVLSVTDGRMPNLMKTLKPILFDFGNPRADDIEWKRDTSDGFQTAITVPLINRGNVEGVCDLLYREKPEVNEDWFEWISDLGRLVGVILYNSLLMEEMIGLRLSDEIKRLSEEIHDNLSQSINAVSFEAGNMKQSLLEGDLKLLTNQLSRLSKSSDEALKILRGEMSQLHNENMGSGTNLSDIKEYFNGFSKRWGLDIVFEQELEHGEINISARVGTQLIRILNEAMNNVVRHSGATVVKVVIREGADSLSIKIIDNGCGFDFGSIGSDKLGLRSMKERARKVGGDIKVESQFGKGTQVDVFIPHLI